MKQEQWSRIERDQSALKEEKVSVSSGTKKASVRKETNAVSGMRVTIKHKNQNTLPPRLLSQAYCEWKQTRPNKAGTCADLACGQGRNGGSCAIHIT